MSNPATDFNPFSQIPLEQLLQRTSAKWRAYPGDVLPMWVAEMDVPIAQPVVDAAVAALQSGDTGYPAGNAYVEAFSDYARDHWDWSGITIENATPAPDVMRGIMELLELVSSPSDTVLLNSPVYPPFHQHTKHTGRHIEEVPLGSNGRMDLALLEEGFHQAALHGRHSVFLLSNPHNPTGAVHTRDELTALAAIANKYHVRVISDEIHAPIIMPGNKFVPFLSVPGSESHFAVISASKAWNLAGLKAAVIISGEASSKELKRLPDWVKYGPSHVGVIAHVAALREGQPWLESVLSGIAANRDHLQRELAAKLPAVRYQPGEGTYLAWLDCTELGLGDDPMKIFLEQGRVAFNSGIPFGVGGAGHVRMNIGTSPEIISEGVRRMAAAIG